MQAELESGLPPDVIEAIAAGRKIEAIKLLREQTGMGLKEARDIVDAVAPPEAGFAEHRASPRNDTGIGRLILVFALLGGLLAGYLLLQS